MNEIHLSPAETLIRAMGGVRNAARILGRNASSICRWNQPKDHPSGRGIGGIPHKLKPVILAKAKELGLDLTEHDLEHGRRI